VDEVAENLPFYEIFVFHTGISAISYNFHRHDGRIAHVTFFNNGYDLEAAFQFHREALPTMVIIHSDIRRNHRTVLYRANEILRLRPSHEVNFIISSGQRPSLNLIRSLLPRRSQLIEACLSMRHTYVYN
ncbi:hypothetical protein PFISCL1PPCAC_20403, partial [Pristionchus fissidentatus]